MFAPRASCLRPRSCTTRRRVNSAIHGSATSSRRLIASAGAAWPRRRARPTEFAAPGAQLPYGGDNTSNSPGRSASDAGRNSTDDPGSTLTPTRPRCSRGQPARWLSPTPHTTASAAEPNPARTTAGANASRQPVNMADATSRTLPRLSRCCNAGCPRWRRLALGSKTGPRSDPELSGPPWGCASRARGRPAFSPPR